MKSNRSIIIFGVIFLCLCLILAGVGAVYFYFQSRPPSSLTSGSGYYIRLNTVYYLAGFPSTAFAIQGANARTFKVIDSQYGLDDAHVYLSSSPIEDADPSTFELLTPPFSQDARHIYASESIFTDDVANFEILGENITRDSQHVYWSSSIISDDPSHLVVLVGGNSYTYLQDSTTVFVNGNPIPGADPSTFEIISDAYSHDDSHIFYFNEIISEADSASFEVLEIPFSRDADSVFWMENLIDGADSDTFHVLNADFECSADATTAYYQDQSIPNFDPTSIPANSQVTNCDINGMYFSP